MSRLGRQLSFATQAARYLGPGWLVQRLWFAVQHRTHWHQRVTPSRPWEQFSDQDLFTERAATAPDGHSDLRQRSPVAFLFDPSRLAWPRALGESWDSRASDNPPAAGDLAQQVANLARGKFSWFEHWTNQVGCPPDWHVNVETGQRLPSDLHWSRIPDFANGDIKLVWELSRFGWVFPLIRQYHRTHDESLPELFWALLEDWAEHNPPYDGANWKCGQETSLRIMSWSFAIYGFATAKATSPARIHQLVRMIGVSARRVEAHLPYALSQQNNHGVSEGMGLWTAGLLFPELRYADRWRQRGRQVLEQLADQLIYDDGGFSQHSWNYHRVMLHLYLWSVQLGRVNQVVWPSQMLHRLAQAGDLLVQMTDPTNGGVPCYGQNDGAMVLPLTSCDSRDYRPVGQAVSVLTHGHKCYAAGPWDEALWWLFGDAGQPVRAPERPTSLVSSPSGYVLLQSESSRVATRCGALRHRPSHADQLHVDLWWRGENIAVDAGTYSYNAPSPWNNPFAETRYHNTVTVDGLDQMNRVSRFLWLPWIQGIPGSVANSTRQYLTYWQGSHTGFERLASPVGYRREVLFVRPDCWVILDDLHGTASHDYRLHWLLVDAPYTWNPDSLNLQLSVPQGDYQLCLHGEPHEGATADVVLGEPESCRGWRARYYHQREPAISIALTTRSTSQLYCSVFAPSTCVIQMASQHVEIRSPHWNATVEFDSIDNGRSSKGRIRSATLHSPSEVVDRLVIAP
ncbi:MAG: alginate lyase family protein [Planctomycetales bacterium]|nr:alginate lyase family protein [Planctomycetales bacterium]